jgi:hypothetical protein
VGYCDGTQGTALRVTGGTTDEIVIGGGGLRAVTSTQTTGGYAVWRVYVAGVYRGVHGKNGDETFGVARHSANRGNYLYRSSNPSGVLHYWRASSLQSISRLEFSHGSPPVTTCTTRILSADGSELRRFSKQGSCHSVSLIECGCPESDCQRGSFPDDFCCTNCAQQAGILSGILGALQGVG